ncbi:MAG: aminodeoxychorismate/anthranilate synthase component II [Deltaproteobacteria bacterium]|nr:aminodeoxychorismate/anthranilate synthase component II [Deltaproteobacteria bacterium]
MSSLRPVAVAKNPEAGVGIKLLILDNYDSFTYNLVQYLGELGATLDVVRNDVETLEQLLARKPDGLVISPGPGVPQAAGQSLACVKGFSEAGIPVFGVCLGHQAIGEAFGGNVVRASRIMHGKTSQIQHENKGVFRGLPNPFEATRYHSLIVDQEGFPKDLEVTARTAEGVIMGLRHRRLPVEGVQFHPESILTFEGKNLLSNFLQTCGERKSA